jgi:hypothetical protein
MAMIEEGCIGQDSWFHFLRLLEWAGDNRRYEGNYLFMNMIEGEGIT